MGKYNSVLKFSFLVFYFFVIFCVFVSSVPLNPISIKYQKIKEFSSLVPQGWAFFTRSPREAQILVYKINKDTQLELEIIRHSQPENVFGLNRVQSFKMNELQLIVSKLDRNLFLNTSWNYMNNLHGILPKKVNVVQHVFKHSRLINKEIVIIIQDIVPWAWKKNKNLMMPAKAIRLKIL